MGISSRFVSVGQGPFLGPLLGLAVAPLVALLLWDASGLDLVLAHWSGTAHGFAHRNDWLLTTVLHDCAKYTAWGLVVGLCASVAWPLGRFAELPFARRLQLPAVALIATAAVAMLKANSRTSCPWDLAEFGGVARHVSHWSGWLLADGGSGRCFPAGHASTGFAFVGGWFALRGRWPTVAAWWLAASLAAGLALGAAQQARGAHFMSHTLWTAWMCWMVGWASDPLFASQDAKRAA